jgi:iron complex outermembrane receptor protein
MLERPPSRPRSPILGSCALLLLAGAADAKPIEFSIAAQDLTGALNEFARQSDRELLFATEVTVHLRTTGLSGSYEPEQALAALLAGTGLEFRVTPEGAFLVGSADDVRTRPMLREVSRKVGAYLRSVAAGFALAAAAAPALAQESAGAAEPVPAASAEDSVLGEVLVTAQKREESLKNVPISITAFSREELESLRVQGVEDYIGYVPNATFTKFNNLGSDVTLRGMSSAAGGRYDPIGVTVDDAGFSTTNTGTILAARFLDIERVEILRGPQGTLTGRNSMGGTLNIISVKPHMQGSDYQATVDIGRYDSLLAKASLNLPLSERFALRPTFYAERSDGAVRNVGPAGGSSDTDNHGGRIAARWLPAEAVSIDAWVGFEKQKYGLEHQLPRDVFYDEFDRASRIQELTDLGGDYYDADFISEVGNDGGNIRTDTRDATEIEDWIGSFRAAVDLDRHRLDFIYGHFNYEASNTLDGDRSEFAVWRWNNDNRLTTDSYEARVTSSYGSAVEWVGGVSYLTERNHGTYFGDIGDLAFDGAYTPYEDYFENSRMQSLGVFANLFWDITARLHLSAGARWNRELTSYESQYVAEGLEFNTPYSEATLKRVTPRIALNFDVSETITVYGQVGTGHRAGYGNVIRSVIEAGAPASVKPEELINYEIGAKGSLFDGRARFAAAVFHMDWKDMQVFREVAVDDPDSDDPADLLYYGFDVNAGKAEATGFELEAATLLGRGFEARVNVGHVDSKLDELFGFTDVPVPSSRPWTANASLLHRHRLGNGLKIDSRLDYIWADDTAEWIDSNPVYDLPGYDLVNLSIGLSSERWSAMLYGENVLDETYWISTSAGPNLRGAFVTFVPRTFGLRFTFHSK